MVRINWTFQAKEDLKSITEYISRDSKPYTKHLVIRLINKSKILKSNPLLGKIVLEINKRNRGDNIKTTTFA